MLIAEYEIGLCGYQNTAGESKEMSDKYVLIYNACTEVNFARPNPKSI
jgi:hypothetical protein